MRFSSLADTSASFYDEIGLMSGLEIHQQLLTEKKLFCRCPAGCYSRQWDAEILRHMRPTLSELGEYDGTALMEFKTRKNIIYRINKDTVCTYEFDDTPPFKINPDAVDIALEITMLLNCNLVSEFHIARKQYLDGSIPTGFQRTTILGVEGWIPYRDRRIGIFQLSLEEDSCREVSDMAHERTYITDRLGMPLIETVTYPHMHTPQDVAGVAQVLRYLVRATGHVRTGAGAARQDVNVSIRGGTRCEIKGVGSIRGIPQWVHHEAFRQVGLLEIKDEMHRRGPSAGNEFSTFDVSESLRRARGIPLSLMGHPAASCVVLRDMAGILDHSLGEHRRFRDEVADRVRVIACLTTTPLFSDQGRSLPPEVWAELRTRCGARDQDALVLLLGPEEDVKTGSEEVVIRAQEAREGVPNETRQPMPDGSTRFERILPGPDRMYPDTDLPPEPISPDRVKSIQVSLPTPPWEREQICIEELGLHPELARTLSRSTFGKLFDQLCQVFPKQVRFIASFIARDLPRLSRKFRSVAVDETFLEACLRQVDKGLWFRESFLRALSMSMENGGQPLDPKHLDAIKTVESEHLEQVLHLVRQRVDKQTFRSESHAFQWAMGDAMRTLDRRVDGPHLARRMRTLLMEGETP